MSDEPVEQVSASVSEGSTEGLERLTEEVLPALIARLRASRLGELEVRGHGWRIRLRREASVANRTITSKSGSNIVSTEDAGAVARSPAVGYFKPAPDLVVGAIVVAGDLLGSIDVLGVVQEVIAPADGIVSGVLAEDGQAVEYGQALADIEALDLDLVAAGVTVEAVVAD